uniref:Uncharacterized protein n=1 Tax=Solibacter usitatus (strain Ellin6076) TaxID=234267 RepID=Q021E1_SOLUE
MSARREDSRRKEFPTSARIIFQIALQLRTVPAYGESKLAGIHGVAFLAGAPVAEVNIHVRDLKSDVRRIVVSGVYGSFALNG